MISMRISVEDDGKGVDLLRFLQDINYLTVHVEQPLKEDNVSLDDAFGIWKDRELSLADIRKKGWQRC